MTTFRDFISDRKEVILMGDFNGRTEYKHGDKFWFRESVVKDNGQRLLDLYKTSSLKIT